MSSRNVQFFVLLAFFASNQQRVQSNVIQDDASLRGNAISIEKSLVKYVDAFDAKHPKYPLIGDWMVLTRQDELKNEPRGSSEHDIFTRLMRFIQSRSIDIHLPGRNVAAIARNFLAKASEAVDEEGRSSKLKRFIIPFVVLMILKKSIEIPIFLAVVSLIAFKGLGAGLVSLMLSGATAFKSLLEHHASSKVSYEVVPQINHWSRSGNAAPVGAIDYPNFGDYHTIPHGN